MRSILPFIVLGLVDGSVYGLTAMGLVLTYKTTGVFNFAHGAVATGAAYLFFEYEDSSQKVVNTIGFNNALAASDFTLPVEFLPSTASGIRWHSR